MVLFSSRASAAVSSSVRSSSITGQRVAEHRIGTPRFDFLDEVLVVERGLGLEQVGDGERNGRGLIAAVALCLYGGVVVGCCLEDAVRRDPQLMQTVGDSGGRGAGRVLSCLVPGKLPAYSLRRTLTRRQRRPAAARGRIAVGADVLVAHRRGFVIDGS